MAEIVYPQESYRIIGACFEIYNEKGNGFLESVYQECLEIAFQDIEFAAQPELGLTYRDQTLKKTFKPDFICYKKIIVEIKAVSRLVDEHRSQVISYLNATKMKLGILVNFGQSPKLEYERFALTGNKGNAN